MALVAAVMSPTTRFRLSSLRFASASTPIHVSPLKEGRDTIYEKAFASRISQDLLYE